MKDFYNNYVCECNKIGKSPSRVAIEIGLSKTAVNGWKTGKSNPTDATVQKIADYFGVATSVLRPEACPEFYENFLRLCTEHKKSPSGVAIAIGLSNAAASGWKKGKWPNDTTLYKIANYFGVSVEELKGQKEKTATPSGDSLSSDDPLTTELKAEIDTMSPDHKELLLAQIRIMKERTAK